MILLGNDGDGDSHSLTKSKLNINANKDKKKNFFQKGNSRIENDSFKFFFISRQALMY